MAEKTYGFLEGLWKTVVGDTMHPAHVGQGMPVAAPADLNLYQQFMDSYTQDLKNAYFSRVAEEISAIKQSTSSGVDAQFLDALNTLNAQYAQHYLEIGQHVSEMTGVPFDGQILIEGAEEPQRWLNTAFEQVNQPKNEQSLYQIIRENIGKVATLRNVTITLIALAVGSSGCLTQPTSPTAHAPDVPYVTATPIAATPTHDDMMRMTPREFFNVVSTAKDPKAYCGEYAERKKLNPEKNGDINLDATCDTAIRADSPQIAKSKLPNATATAEKAAEKTIDKIDNKVVYAEGKGLKMTIGGVDWSRGDMAWFVPAKDMTADGIRPGETFYKTAEQSTLDALGLKIDGDDLVMVYVPRDKAPNGKEFDDSGTVVMLSDVLPAVGGESPGTNYYMTLRLLRSGVKDEKYPGVDSRIITTSSTVEFTDKGKAKQVRLKGFAKVMRGFDGGETATVSVARGFPTYLSDLDNRMLDYTSVAEQLGFCAGSDCKELPSGKINYWYEMLNILKEKDRTKQTQMMMDLQTAIAKKTG